MKKIIGIMSGKGGVGKTTMALNLGLAMQQFDENVTIIDCDIKNPNLGLYLGMYQFSMTMNDILKRNSNLTDARYVHTSGIKIIPAALALTSSTIGLTRLKTLLDEIDDYILIDFAPGLGRDTMSLLEICDENLIITNPNIPSIASTLRLMNIIKSQGKNILGVIVNRAGKSYEMSLEDIEMVCSVPMLEEIPEDENVRKSAMLKTPVLDYKPYSKASIRFKEIAAKILGKEYKTPRFSMIKNILS